MHLLYGSLICFTLLALSLLALPLINNRAAFRHFAPLAIFLVLFSFTMYQFSGNKPSLYAWLSSGQYHYSLLKEFDRLGGVDGAIHTIQTKLEKNPNDARGWLILGKLLLAKQENNKARSAFLKAYELNPKDIQIAQIYKSIENPA